MKKAFSLFLAFVLVFSFSVAFAEDYSKMTSDELQRIIDSAQNELFRRNNKFSENCTLYDDNNIQLYLTGKCSIRDHSFDEGVKVVEFEAIFINDSDQNISLRITDCYVNGWSASASNEFHTVKAGKKAKGTIRIDTSAIQKMEDFEEIEWTLCFKNADNSKTFDEADNTVCFPLSR